MENYVEKPWNVIGQIVCPSSEKQISWVEQNLGLIEETTVAVSDNIATIPGLIYPWVKSDYVILGTDGFGR